MSTYHEVGAEALLSKVLLDAEAAQVFAETRQHFAAGKYDAAHVDMIGQMFRCGPKDWPLAQVAAYVQIHASIGEGIYAQVGIQVGATPAADRHREANAESLADLPEPFTTSVDLDQNCGDQDGHLKWNEPIGMMKSTGEAFYNEDCRIAWPGRVLMGWPARVGTAPLEIGYTMPSRTMLHLLQEGAVARWPYGSEWLHLIVDVKRYDIRKKPPRFRRRVAR